MKRLLILPAAALLSVSASPPELDSVNAAPAPGKAPAAQAPVATASGYPPCTATRTDRCIQVPRSSVRRYAAPSPQRRQLAMRAGERG